MVKECVRELEVRERKGYWEMRSKEFYETDGGKMKA